ncbi:MAG TPA: hypothetical protein DCL54_07715 [Alphaproteobacteria bacterium]|nr:hypothetical protein [Alphaproteobacteria bacterium]HAJ46450.1 hypothetical protein [Alphaproteobacteria bacterium]
MDLLRAAVNLILAIGQIAATVYLFSSGFQSAQGPMPQAEPTPIEPAGYAFIIWAPIYIGCVIYALWLFSPEGMRDPVSHVIGWATVPVFAACVGWLFAAAWGPVIFTIPLIVVMFAGLASTLLTVTAGTAAMSWSKYLCVVVPLSLYCGWVSVALFANASEVLPSYGFNRFGLDVETWTLLMLGVAGLVAAYITWTTASPVYTGAVIWALIAISVGSFNRGPYPVVAAAALGLAVTLVLLMWVRLQRAS